jgi:hypothetical protein
MFARMLAGRCRALASPIAPSQYILRMMLECQVLLMKKAIVHILWEVQTLLHVHPRGRGGGVSGGRLME